MSRSDRAAVSLVVFGLGALFLGSAIMPANFHGGGSEYTGLALIAFAIFATGCLCTGAVLWARSDREP